VDIYLCLFTESSRISKEKPSKYTLKDSHNATAQELADSKIGGGSRSGQSKVRKKLLDEDNSNNNGVYTCWRLIHFFIFITDSIPIHSCIHMVKFLFTK